MLETSSTYKQLIAGEHYFDTMVIIGGVEYQKGDLRQVTLSEATFPNGVPEVGGAVSKQLTVKLNLTDAEIPRMAEVVPYYRVVKTNEPGTHSEWIKLGTFWLDYRETKQAAGIMVLECYDAMVKAEAAYTSALSFPASAKDVYSEICDNLGCNKDEATWNMLNATPYSISKPGTGAAALSMRSVLQYIAASYVGSFVITADDKLRLITIGNDALPEETFYLLTELNAAIEIGGYIYGTNGYLYEVT